MNLALAYRTLPYVKVAGPLYSIGLYEPRLMLGKISSTNMATPYNFMGKRAKESFVRPYPTLY